MGSTFKALPMAFKMILKDPVNLLLSLFPTVIALALYFLTFYLVWSHYHEIAGILGGYISNPDHASWVARLLVILLVIFLFFVMSWTFVILVGIIAAPFNSLLSARIEKSLLQHVVDPDKKEAMQKIKQSLGQTFKNELKKLVFIAIVGAMAFVLNLFPLFYPIGIFLVAVLLSVQFVDYSWSRHEMHFGACLKDVMSNIFPYSLSGFLFLLLVTVPIVNAFVPALATSYYTVLWLHRQNKLPA